MSYVEGIRRYQRGRQEIVNSDDRQDHGHQNEMKYKHRTHKATLKDTNPTKTRASSLAPER